MPPQGSPKLPLLPPIVRLSYVTAGAELPNLPAEHDEPRDWHMQGNEAPQLMSFQLPLP